MLAAEGAKVMASARREERLRQLKDELAGHTLEICAADAGKAADMDRLAAETKRVFGPVNLLVYATGTNTPDRSMPWLSAPPAKTSFRQAPTEPYDSGTSPRHGNQG